MYQECTGIAALNGDATNTPSWTITATPPGGVKGTAVTLGQVIKRDSGTSYQICTIAGTAGSGAEPAFSDTAGTTTADNTVTWTSLGVVGNFTGWQAPHARLKSAAASTWGQAGNSFFVASEHAETRATADTITFPGTAASPNLVYCVTKTTLPPVSANLTTGGSILTTVASDIVYNGFAYFYGLTIACGSGSSNANLLFSNLVATGLIFDTCTLKLVGSNAASRMVVGNNNPTNADQVVTFKNTTVQFANASQGIVLGAGKFSWERTASAIQGATLPTTLITTASTTQAGRAILEGVDLSALASGKTLVGATADPQLIILKDCRLGASVTVAAAPTGWSGAEVIVIRADSSGTNYRHEKYTYTGTQTVDTTIIRTGGATDGTTVLSWKVVSTANSRWVLPFECIPITQWIDSTGSHTVTVYGTTTGGGVPKDDEIWIDAVYLKDSGDPLGGFQTTTKADNLAASAATNNSADSSTWAGGGAGNGFKIVSPSFTVNQKGYVTVYVKVAKATATYYIDPLLTVG